MHSHRLARTACRRIHRVPSRTPLKFARAALKGQTVLVDRQPYLPLQRDHIWDLVRRLVPEAEWPSAARVLACLEAIYKVEFQQQCEATSAILEAVNNSLVHTEPLPSVSPPPRSDRRRRNGPTPAYNAPSPSLDAPGHDSSPDSQRTGKISAKRGGAEGRPRSVQNGAAAEGVPAVGAANGSVRRRADVWPADSADADVDSWDTAAAADGAAPRLYAAANGSRKTSSSDAPPANAVTEGGAATASVSQAPVAASPPTSERELSNGAAAQQQQRSSSIKELVSDFAQLARDLTKRSGAKRKPHDTPAYTTTHTPQPSSPSASSAKDARESAARGSSPTAVADATAAPAMNATSVTPLSSTNGAVRANVRNGAAPETVRNGVARPAPVPGAERMNASHAAGDAAPLQPPQYAHSIAAASSEASEAPPSFADQPGSQRNVKTSAAASRERSSQGEGGHASAQADKIDSKSKVAGETLWEDKEPRAASGDERAPAADGAYYNDSSDSGEGGESAPSPDDSAALLLRSAKHGPLSAQQAAQLDRVFMQRLLFLAERAHFGGLRPRTVALANSLANSDRLSQLFVKVDITTLDASFTTPFIDSQLPEEAKAVLMMTRGVGTDTRSGRLLVPKLDYLQLMAVRWVKEAFSLVGAQLVAAWNNMRTMNEDMVELLAPPDKQPDDGGPSINEEIWGSLKDRGRDAIIAMGEWGLSPRLFSVGGGVIMALADWGLIPRVDVIPLSRFDQVWRVTDKKPVALERISIDDVFARQSDQSLAQRFFDNTTLQEPTFSQLLVVYRRKEVQNKFEQLRRRILAPEEDELEPFAKKRQPVQLKVLDNIPMAYWQVVFPDKLLQFRPLDGLRLDLITLAGVAAVAAQVKFTSVLLEIVSLTSIVVLVVRTFLGYQRMFQRYENFANDLVASKLVAGQDTAVLQFLAVSAANQQFAQAALAYALLTRRAAHARADVAALAAAEALAAAAEASGDEDSEAAARRAELPLREGWLRPWLLGEGVAGAVEREEEAAGRRGNATLQLDAEAEKSEAEKSEAGEVAQRAKALLAEVLGDGRRWLTGLRTRLTGAGSEPGRPAGPGLTIASLQAEMEDILNKEPSMPVRFNAHEALGELARFQLLQHEDSAVRAWMQDALQAEAESSQQMNVDGRGGESSQAARSGEMCRDAVWENGSSRQQQRVEVEAAVDEDVRVVAVTSQEALHRVSTHWNSLLERSATAILSTIM